MLDARSHVQRTRVATVAITLLGVGLGTIQILTWPAATRAELFTSVPFVLVSVALAYVGYWLAVSDSFADDADRVLAWTVGSATTFGAVAVLVFLAGPPYAAGMSGLAPIGDTLTAGALAGALVGLYDAQSRDRLVALEAERARIEAFANKAKSLNRYGKALNQSRDLFEVSALSIEVLELLIGSRDAAVLLVDEADTTILDATVGAVSEEFLQRTAELAATKTPMESVRCPEDISCSIPPALSVDEVVAVPVSTESDATLVLLALPDPEDPYSSEDLDLLETLSAHVGTALSRVSIDDADVESRPN